MINDLLNPWRSDLENAPEGEQIHAYREAGEAHWLLCWNNVKRAWLINGTNQSVVFTHWRRVTGPNDPTAEKLLDVLRAASKLSSSGKLDEPLIELIRLWEALPQTLRDELKGGSDEQ